MKLYELSEQYTGLMRAIENGELDDEQAIADSMEAIQASFDDKAESIALIIKNMSAEADAISKEVDALKERESAKKNTVERLKNYLAGNLLSIGQMKLETPKVRLTFRKSESVQITDEAALFAACQHSGIEGLTKTKIEYSFNKKEIGKVIKEGHELQGAEIVTKQNIQIK